MTDFKNLFEQAQMAEAAYATFDGGVSSAAVKTALEDNGFSESQATIFVNQWSVVHQYIAPPVGITDGSGFSATLFRNNTTDEYASADNHSIVNLQVIAETMSDFNLSGEDALRNNKIESFDFLGLVEAFDADSTPANWQLTDTRLLDHLAGGSDTEAIGGDLTYQYGMTGNLAGMGLGAVQNVICSSVFAQTGQTLNSPSVWQAEVVKLA